MTREDIAALPEEYTAPQEHTALPAELGQGGIQNGAHKKRSRSSTMALIASAVAAGLLAVSLFSGSSAGSGSSGSAISEADHQFIAAMEQLEEQLGGTTAAATDSAEGSSSDSGSTN